MQEQRDRKEQSRRQRKVIAALALLSSAAFLVFLGWVCLFQGLSSKQYRDNPEQLSDYITLAVQPGDEVFQHFVPATRGIYSLYLFTVTDVKEDNAVLQLRLEDSDGLVISTTERMLKELSSADWNLFTLKGSFQAGQTYTIAYSLTTPDTETETGQSSEPDSTTGELSGRGDQKEAVETSDSSRLYLLLCSAEQEAVYSPDAVYHAAVLNEDEQDGAVIQNLEMCYPYSRATQIGFFLIGLAGVVCLWLIYLKKSSRYNTEGRGQKLLDRLRHAEDRIHGFLYKNIFRLCVIAALVVSVYLRYCFVAFQSDDYVSYLYKWYRHFREFGFVNGLATMAHDYYVPYNLFLALIARLNLHPRISIMALSCTCDYLCALYLGKISYFLINENRECISNGNNIITSRNDGTHSKKIPASGKRKRIEWAGGCEQYALRLSWGVALIWLFLPPVWLDSAMWKQCDTVYLVFCLASLYQLLKKEYTSSFVLLTIGFVIKLQAAFLLPLYVIVYLAKRDFRITKFLYLPAGYFLAGLPAILCGADPSLIYTTYSNQTTGMQTYMHSFLPNVYMFLESDDYTLFGTAAVLMTLALFILAAAYSCAHRRNLTSENLILIAAWCAWTCPMFLPSMTPRYDLIAYALVMLAALVLDRRLLPIAAVFTGITTICFLCYLLYAYKEVNFQVMAFFYVGSYLVYSIYVWTSVGKRSLIYR